MSDKTLHHNTTAVNRVSLRAHVLLLLAAFLTLLSCGGRECRGDDGADTLEKILTGNKDAPREKKILKIIPTELIIRESS